MWWFLLAAFVCTSLWTILALAIAAYFSSPFYSLVLFSVQFGFLAGLAIVAVGILSFAILIGKYLSHSDKSESQWLSIYLVSASILVGIHLCLWWYRFPSDQYPALIFWFLNLFPMVVIDALFCETVGLGLHYYLFVLPRNGANSESDSESAEETLDVMAAETGTSGHKSSDDDMHGADVNEFEVFADVRYSSDEEEFSADVRKYLRPGGSHSRD